jgi:Uma2 family endonuclease
MQAHAEPIPPLVSQASPPEGGQCVVLYGVSWATYERLLADFQDSHAAHFAYDRGGLEIMVLSAEHEDYKDMITLLVNILAEEMNIDVRSFGSTTFQRADLERGFDPDGCFYIQHEAQVRGKKKLDLTVDPPPDLVIEIDISRPSLNKLPMYAQMGVGEVWRYDGRHLTIFKLEGNGYVERADSAALPKVTGEALTNFVEEGKQVKRTTWLRRVRQWVQQHTEESD